MEAGRGVGWCVLVRVVGVWWGCVVQEGVFGGLWGDGGCGVCWWVLGGFGGGLSVFGGVCP